MRIDQSQCNEGPTNKSDMRARMLGAPDIVVQKGIGEAQVFLLTHASWAEPNGSVYWSSSLQENNERKNTLASLLCVLRCIIKCFIWNLLLFEWEINWSCFSQCFVLLSTTFHYSLPSNVLCLQLFWVILSTNKCPLPLNTFYFQILQKNNKEFEHKNEVTVDLISILHIRGHFVTEIEQSYQTSRDSCIVQKKTPQIYWFRAQPSRQKKTRPCRP